MKSDVLHVVEGEPQATIIADLSSADHIPSDTFDCVILTQTLQPFTIFAPPSEPSIAFETRVLLATFPGISQSYDSEWGESCNGISPGYLRGGCLTKCFHRLASRLRRSEMSSRRSRSLHGVAVEESTTAELDYRDAGYDVTIAVRAQKPS